MKDISKDSKISDNNLKDVNGGSGSYNGIINPFGENEPAHNKKGSSANGAAFPNGALVYLRNYGNEQFKVKGSLFDYGYIMYWVAPVSGNNYLINQTFRESDLSSTPF